jgi:hypothetical protein
VPGPYQADSSETLALGHHARQKKQTGTHAARMHRWTMPGTLAAPRPWSTFCAPQLPSKCLACRPRDKLLEQSYNNLTLPFPLGEPPETPVQGPNANFRIYLHPSVQRHGLPSARIKSKSSTPTNHHVILWINLAVSKSKGDDDTISPTNSINFIC